MTMHGCSLHVFIAPDNGSKGLERLLRKLYAALWYVRVQGSDLPLELFLITSCQKFVSAWIDFRLSESAHLRSRARGLPRVNTCQGGIIRPAAEKLQSVLFSKVIHSECAQLLK